MAINSHCGLIGHDFATLILCHLFFFIAKIFKTQYELKARYFINRKAVQVRVEEEENINKV